MLGHFKHVQRIFVFSNNLSSVTAVGVRNFASKNDSSCCKPISQTEDKKVVEWPADPPPPWFKGSINEPQPPNYDPYKIKLPEVVVPPLPPSHAKLEFWTWSNLRCSNQGWQGNPYQQQGCEQQPEKKEDEQEEAETSFLGRLKSFFGRNKKNQNKSETDNFVVDDKYILEIPKEECRNLFQTPIINFPNQTHGYHDMQCHPMSIVHPDYWKDKPMKKKVEEKEVPKLSYHGRSKYKYAFHEPWKPLDRLTLMQQAESEELEDSDAVETDSSK